MISVEVERGAVARLSGKFEAMSPREANRDEKGRMTPDGKLLGPDGKTVVSAGAVTTVVNISKAIMGASSFELPWAFAQAGLLGSVIGIVVVGFLTNECFGILAGLGSLCGLHRPTYPQIGYACMGATGEALVWFGMVMMTVGVVGSYLLFVGEILKDFAEGTPLATQPHVFFVLTAALPGALLSMFRSTQRLAFTSILGLSALGVAFVAIFIDAMSRDSMPPVGTWLEVRPLFVWDTFPLFLGGVNYLYLISTAILPIEQEMHPHMRKGGGFRAYFTFAQLMTTAPNIVLALVAWMTYSSTPEGIKGNVIQNLLPGAANTMVKALMAANQLFTVPLFLIPMADAFERRLLAPAEFGTTAGEMKRNVCRVALALSAASIAVLLPNFGLLTGFTGAFGNNMLAFIFVPLFYFQRLKATGYWKQKMGRQHAKDLVRIVVLFAFGVGTLLLTGTSTALALLK